MNIVCTFTYTSMDSAYRGCPPAKALYKANNLEEFKLVHKQAEEEMDADFGIIYFHYSTTRSNESRLQYWMVAVGHHN